VTPSISRRLILWLAIPLMLLALCGALVHYFNSVAPGVISSDRRLKAASNALMARVVVKDGQVALNMHPEGANGNPPLPIPDSIKYALHDSQGHLLLGDPQLPAVAMSNETTQLFAMSQVDHLSLRSLTTRFDTRAGVIFITVADARAPVEPAARFSFVSTLLWDFVQLDITLVLAWVGIYLGLRPIRRLRDEIAERSPHDLRPIVETSVPREIAPVVVTLNRLFAMLRTAAQSQQQFIANTAHQLRTPITGMQAQLDLLAAEPAAQPIKHRLLTLQEGIRQLAHSANQLITLARADPAANVAARTQVVDLCAIVGEVVAKFFDRALQSGIDLGVDAQPAHVRADPSLLDDLLSNLVDNALKYTPARGTVTVSAGVQNLRPYLAVEDTGPGIPREEHDRVRQRFYRLPNSPGHGSGLGLAIVDEIARQYGATMSIGAGAHGNGTRILVQFEESHAPKADRPAQG
jgi:two-component system, OmpR family, sensor histidine kinase TctE